MSTVHGLLFDSGVCAAIALDLARKLVISIIMLMKHPQILSDKET